MRTKPRNHQQHAVIVNDAALTGIRKRAQDSLSNGREAMTSATLALLCDAMVDTLRKAPEFASRNKRRLPAAPSARLRTLSNVAWCLDVREDANTDPTLVVAHVLSWVADVLRGEVREIAVRKDVPAIWEDASAIESRLLRDEVGLGSTQIGRVRVSGTPNSGPDDGLEPRAQARRKEAERRAKQMRRVFDPLIGNMLTGIRKSGVAGTPPESLLKDLARRASIAALADPACLDEIQRIQPRVGRPRSSRRPLRTN